MAVKVTCKQHSQDKPRISGLGSHGFTVSRPINILFPSDILKYPVVVFLLTPLPANTRTNS